MELFDAFVKRHSYRGEFTDKKITREELAKIVETGVVAPSGCNAQSTEFVIIDDENIVSQITSMPGSNTAFQQAKAFIACIIDKDPKPVYEDLSFQVEDCSAAVENMLLAITAMGYASVWIDGWLRREGRNDKISQLIGLPQDKVVRIMLPVGEPAGVVVPPAKKSFEERVWFNKYGG